MGFHYDISLLLMNQHKRMAFGPTSFTQGLRWKGPILYKYQIPLFFHLGCFNILFVKPTSGMSGIVASHVIMALSLYFVDKCSGFSNYY